MGAAPVAFPAPSTHRLPHSLPHSGTTLLSLHCHPRATTVCPMAGPQQPKGRLTPAAALAVWAELVGFSPKLRKPRGWGGEGVAAPGGPGG